VHAPHPHPLLLPPMRAGQIAPMTRPQLTDCRAVETSPSRASETQDSQLEALLDGSSVARQSLKLSSWDGHRSSAMSGPLSLSSLPVPLPPPPLLSSPPLVGLGTGALTREGGLPTGPGVLRSKVGAAVGLDAGQVMLGHVLSWLKQFCRITNSAWQLPHSGQDSIAEQASCSPLSQVIL
jgi:hypothetical protein